MAENTITGMIWVGPIFHTSGYGSVSRTCLLGLARLGFPVRAVNCGPDDRKLLDPRSYKEIAGLLRTDVGQYPVGLVHCEPTLYPKVRFGHVVKHIGYTIFETDRIPCKWVGLSKCVDELWLPSRFNYKTFVASGVDPAMLRIFPYGVDTEFYTPISEQLEIKGRRGWCFLYVFAFDWRKGFDLLLEAYGREFRAKDDVTLVLKTQSDQHTGRDLERLILGSVPGAGGKDWPHVVVLTEPMDLVQLRRLYNTCDVYVSTERANGWGMPCMEAMAMGKPAAAIDWGGSTEFMNAQNSLLIKPTGRLVPVDERLAAARPLYRGHRWAEVTVDEVRRVLRLAYERRDVLAGVAQQGMHDVREHYSYVKAAERMRDSLYSIPVTAHDTGRPHVRVRRPLGVKRAVLKTAASLKTFVMSTFHQ